MKMPERGSDGGFEGGWVPQPRIEMPKEVLMFMQVTSNLPQIMNFVGAACDFMLDAGLLEEFREWTENQLCEKHKAEGEISFRAIESSVKAMRNLAEEFLDATDPEEHHHEH